MGVWRLLRVTFACLLLALAVSTVHAQELYFIDAHSQVDHDVDAKTIIANMNAAGVRRSILSVRNRSPKFVIQLSKQYPEQLVPPVTTKMWGYIFDSKKPHKKYYKALQGQVRSGKFRAMSEVLERDRIRLTHSLNLRGSSHIRLARIHRVGYRRVSMWLRGTVPGPFACDA